MNEKLEFLYINPDQNLRDKIVTNIDKKIRNQAILNLFYSGLTSFTSMLVMVYSLVLIVKDFYSSGLKEYISLAFSDYSLIPVIWKEYLLSVVESLPIVSVTVVVFSLFVFVLSAKYILNSFKKVSFIKFSFNK